MVLYLCFSELYCQCLEIINNIELLNMNPNLNSGKEKRIYVYDEREGSTSSEDVCSLRLQATLERFKVGDFPK